MVIYLLLLWRRAVFHLPFPGSTLSQAEVSASLEQQVDINLTSKVPGISNGIEETAFKKTNVGSTSKKSNNHNSVDGMHAGPSGDGLQATGNLPF